jgi:hypothetical protein
VKKLVDNFTKLLLGRINYYFYLLLYNSTECCRNSMIRLIISFLLIIIGFKAQAQLQISKLIGKGSEEYSLGYGAFLKAQVPVASASYITLEGSANFFFLKDQSGYGWVTIPVKVGYKYMLSKAPTGFYVEPQVGYNFLGVDPNDKKFKGLVFAAGIGYTLPPILQSDFDLGFMFETALHKDGGPKYLALRLSYQIGFGKRQQNDE